MLHAAHILCLAVPGSAAPAQALHLARHCDATLHLGALPSCVLAGEGRATIEEPWAPGAEAGVSVRRPGADFESMAAVQHYVHEADVDLVVVDTPGDRGSVPPLAAEATRTLIQQLAVPVFVAGREARPAAFQDLLVPTDLSAPALSAFRHAVCLARLYGATVHVLHVVESLPYVALTRTDRLSLGPHPLSEHRGRRRVRSFLRAGDPEGVSVQAHLVYGDPADQIARFADRTDVDLLVLASHGSGGSPETPLGPVSRRLLGRVPGPLFLVRAFGPSLLPATTETG